MNDYHHQEGLTALLSLCLVVLTQCCKNKATQISRGAFVVANSLDNIYYLRRLYQELEGVSRGGFVPLDRKGGLRYNKVVSDKLSDLRCRQV